MFDNALKLLKIIEEHGYKAYIVGGFPRNLYLGLKSFDIDICTNATPKDIQAIFSDSQINNDHYGSVSFLYHKVRYEVTTFRKDISYVDHRKPLRIQYIDDLKQDLKRRDFTVNTLCIDSSGDMLDLLDVRKDLDNRLIKMVGNPRTRLKEDALRILRAVRFATTLDFDIDPKLKKYIKKDGHLVKKLSSFRKKEELDKIFTSCNAKKGIKLLIDLELSNHLGISNLKNLVLTDSIIGIWAQLSPQDYQFTSHEQKMIARINELKDKNILDYNALYQYGLYECELAGEIKGIDRKKIVKKYNELPIHSRGDIEISANEICALLDKKPDAFLKIIYDDLEAKLINQIIPNNKEDITKYIIDNYKTTK